MAFITDYIYTYPIQGVANIKIAQLYIDNETMLSVIMTDDEKIFALFYDNCGDVDTYMMHDLIVEQGNIEILKTYLDKNKNISPANIDLAIQKFNLNMINYLLKYKQRKNVENIAEKLAQLYNTDMAKELLDLYDII